MCFGLPVMVLTQRLKKRNQSDSVIAETHHDERTITNDMPANEETDEKLKGLKKAKASAHIFTEVAKNRR